MAAKRRNKKRKNTILDVFAFDRSIKVAHKQQVIENIVFKAQSLKGNALRQFLAKILPHRLCPEEIHCRYKTRKSFLTNYRYSFRSTYEELIWFQYLFTLNDEALKSFLDSKNKIDKYILNTKAEEALDEITKIEESFSLSLWGIELRVHIMRELLDEDTSEHISEMKKDMRESVPSYYLQQILLKSESKDISGFIDNLKDNLTELRSSGPNTDISDFANLASSYFLPFEYDKERNVTDRRLTQLTAYSIIDQYLLYKSYIIDKVLHGNGFLEEEMEIILEINKFIHDEELDNLFNDHIPLESIHKEFLTITKYYTEENYLECLEKINSLINEDSLAMSCIEIYSRCNIYLNENSTYNYYQSIALLFKKLILTNSETLESIGELEKIAIKFHFSNWTIPILFHLHRFINEKKDLFLLSTKKAKLLGDKITPAFIEYNYEDLLSILELPIDTLSERKKLKLINKSSLTEKEFSLYSNRLEKVTYIYSDYVQEISFSLLSDKKITECLNFINDNYLNNNILYIVLPIREVIDEIEKIKMNSSNIDIPIIYDIYSKKIDSSKNDTYLEKFQDYIDNFNSYKPSEIFSSHESLSKKDLYFLKNVSIPEILDVYPEYKNSDNLKKERMNILDLLILEDQKYAEIYKKEKTIIFDELIFNKLKTDFDSSKIYVDIESLKKKKEDVYRSLFELACAARNSENSEDEYILLDEKEDLWIPVTDMTTIISKIYTNLFNDFVSNPDYGLDKYLSADIRHGIFVPHMRSGIEAYNLLTEVDEKTYEDNTFWPDKYPLVITEIKSEMNDALKVFSKEFDDILNEANNWFRVWVEKEAEKEFNPNNGLFDFTPTLDRLSLLRDRVTPVDNFEQFFIVLMEFMWEITDEAVAETKNMLNTTLKERLLSSFDNLEASINHCRKSVPMKELLDAIALARNTIHTDLERVLNWFNCVEDKNREQYGLESALNACSETFKTIVKKRHIRLRFSSAAKDDQFFLTYRETRALMSSLFTALINASTYSKQNTNVDIIVTEEGDTFCIRINNKVILPSGIEKDEFISKLREKFSDEYCDLSTSEGGTGLYKIYNLLNNASQRFKFDVNLDEDIFTAEIRISK